MTDLAESAELTGTPAVAHHHAADSRSNELLQQIVFATGATRVVVGTSLLDVPELLHACAHAAGAWLAVGLDPRPERLSQFPWKRAVQPSLDDLLQQLVAAGISRVVMSHGGGPSELSRLREIGQRYPSMEVSVAGGVT
ncbi:MAG: HisA/HisF-related TIM barrel protein, partial [Candidatus Limnocylindrus sp.]